MAVLSIDAVRGGVQDAQPLCCVRQHQVIGDRFLAQQPARRAGDLFVPDIEGGDAAIAMRRTTGRFGAATVEHQTR